MELRRLTICMVMFVIAIAHCSEAHYMQRRQAVDDETMNDVADQSETKQQRRRPKQTVIETAPTNYQVKAGEDVTLECKVPGKKNIVLWSKNDQSLFLGATRFNTEETRYSVSKGSNDLVIKNAQIEDSGVFRCEIITKNPVAINHTLLVTQAPKIIEAHSMQRRQAVDEETYDDQILGDEGFDEEIMNDVAEQSEPKQQPFPNQTVIETAPTNYQVKAGENVTLECKVPEKKIVVLWYKNDQRWFLGTSRLHIEETRYSVSKDSNDLVIKNAQIEDSGVFRCEILTQNPVAINHTLLVTQAPKIIDMRATKNVVVGGELELNCTVSASPMPSLIWSRVRKDQVNERLNEKDGAEFSIEGNVYTMRLKPVKVDSAGKYFCYANNDIGYDQAEYTVIVNVKPQVHVPKTMVNSAIGIQAVLQCVAHGDANPHIRWYKDGMLVEDSASDYLINTEGGHSNLTVTPKADGDFGTFTCEAENDYGKHNRSIELVQSPVVDDLDIDGPKLSWTVHSHQPLEEMELQIKSTNGSYATAPQEGEWMTFRIPVPEGGHHTYDVSYTLEEKVVPPGEYLTTVKVKNTKSWGGINEPAIVNIQDPQSLSIQTASVYRVNAAHSIRPMHTVLSTVLMYLLVRMLY